MNKEQSVLDAIRLLRQLLNHTQQSFAALLGLSISSVVRYETLRAPRGQRLIRFYELASVESSKATTDRKASLEYCAGILKQAMGVDLGTATAYTPVSEGEKLAVKSLLATMRSVSASDAQYHHVPDAGHSVRIQRGMRGRPRTGSFSAQLPH